MSRGLDARLKKLETVIDQRETFWFVGYENLETGLVEYFDRDGVPHSNQAEVEALYPDLKISWIEARYTPQLLAKN